MVFYSTLYNDGEIEAAMPIGVPFLYTKAIEDEELLRVQKQVFSGDLIMFPTNVEHHTTANTSDEFRYSLAFNVGLESFIPPDKSNRST